MVRKPPVWCVSLLIAAAFALLCIAASGPAMPAAAAPLPVNAPAAPAQQATPVHAPEEPTVPAPGATATPTPGGVVSTIQQITTIIHQLRFPFDTMMNGIVKMAGDMAKQSYAAVGDTFRDMLGTLVFGNYGIAPQAAEPPLFKDLIFNHWRVTLGLALLLMPVTLALNAVCALRQGAASTLGFADLKESLVGWLVSAGGAVASYYLLSLFYRLSVSGALAIAETSFGDGGLTPQGMASILFNSAVIFCLGISQPMVSLFLGFFVLFLASSIVLGLALALASFAALMYLLTTLAPILLVLGSLKPLEWLKSLWLKAVVLVLLLPVADVLLLKAASSITVTILNSEAQGHWGTVLAGLCLGAGVLSILITINFKVAELVFGAIAEIGRKAMDATMGVAQMVATVAGVAVGVGAVGALGAAGAGGALGGAGGGGAMGGLVGGGAASGGAAGGTALGSLAGEAGRAGSAVEAGGGLRVTGLSSSVAQRAGGAGDGAASGQALQRAGGGGGGESGASGRPASSTQYPMRAVTQARSARTLESIGRVLSRTGNPLLQGLGRGLEGGGAIASAQAGRALDEHAAARQDLADERYAQGQARQVEGDTHRAERETIADDRYQQSQARQVEGDAHRAERETIADDRYQQGQARQVAGDAHRAERETIADDRYQQGQARQAAGDAHRTEREAIADDRYQQGQVQRAAGETHRVEREVLSDQRYEQGQAQRAAEKVEREADRAERDEKMREREVLGWSQRSSGALPADTFAVGRPANTVMEGGLHRAMMDAGYATNLDDVRQVADAYYGAWQAKYGDQDAAGRARIWQVMSDPGLAESGYPRMVGEMNTLAAELDFQPALSMNAAVQNMFVRAREVERAAPEPAPRVSDVRPPSSGSV